MTTQTATLFETRKNTINEKKIEAATRYLEKLDGEFVTVANLLKDLAEAAFTDPLTGLCNRRKLESLDEDEIKGQKMYYIDFDGFKRLNDTYGHRIGDQVLVEFAKRIQRISSKKRIFRMGGDEFMTISSDPFFGAKLRLLFKNPIVTEVGSIELKFSVGSSVIKDLQKAIEESDERMYSNKKIRR